VAIGRLLLDFTTGRILSLCRLSRAVLVVESVRVKIFVLIDAEQLLVDEQVLRPLVLTVVQYDILKLSEHLHELKVCSSFVQPGQHAFIDFGSFESGVVLVNNGIVAVVGRRALCIILALFHSVGH
jgi:hypothetical protein